MKYIVDNSMLDFQSWGESTKFLNEIFDHLKQDASILDRLDEIVCRHFKDSGIPTDADIHQYLIDNQQEIRKKLGL